jgi:hypothetical protein
MCALATLLLTSVHPGLFFSHSALLKQGRPRFSVSRKRQNKNTLVEKDVTPEPESGVSDASVNVERVIEEGEVKRERRGMS